MILVFNVGVNSMLCLIEIVLKRGGIFRFDIYGRKLFIYGRAVFNILYLLFCG